MENKPKIQKYLAQQGIASRRQVENWISQGRVFVNKEIAQIGQRIDQKDKIIIDGKLIKISNPNQSKTRILILNKPEGVVCTKSDEKGRKNVFHLIPKLKNERWINVGRLDINTTGLLIFTNNGDLANKLMHPSSNIDREYAIRVRGEVTDQILENLKNGIELEDGFAQFTDIQKAPKGDGYNHWFHCVVLEGRNREVRRLWESQGLKVSRLKRVRFGPVILTSDMKVGRYKELNEKEVNILIRDIDLSANQLFGTYQNK